MLKYRLFPFIIIVSLLTVFHGAIAQSLPNTKQITIQSTATLKVKPDAAKVVIRVATVQKDVVSAKQKIDHDINQFYAKLAELGMQKNDFHAANFYSNASYRYEKNSQKPILESYFVFRMVEINVPDLKQLNAILNTALENGLTQVESINFYVKNSEKYQDQVRKKAIQEAKDKANFIVAELGIKLGEVISINYNLPNTNFVRSVYLKQNANKMMSSSFFSTGKSITSTDYTYQDNDIELNDSIEIVFAINQ